MPRPLVKAGSLPGGAAGASSSGIKAPPKVSTLEELSALERVTDPDRPRLRKPAADVDEDAPPAAAAAAAVQPAAAAAAAAASTSKWGAGKAAAAQPAAAAAAPAPVAAAPEPEPEAEAPEDPNALPPGWTAMTDEVGDVFYYNTATAEATWEKPPMPEKPKPAPKPVAAAPAAAAAAPAAAGTPAGAADAEETCGQFEPNPFKKDICKRCRKKADKH
jgi:translation initiation factor IF-2